MKLFIVTIALTLISASAQSADIYPGLQQKLNEVLQVNEGLTYQPNCDATGSSTLYEMPCEQITDNFCSRLWSKENKGNLKVFDGQILKGTSKKSKIAITQWLDDQATIASLAKLAPDLRKELGPIVKQWKAAYAEERDDDTWYDSLSIFRFQYENGIKKVAHDRVLKEHPDWKNISKENQTLVQSLRYQEEEMKIEDDLVDAKYAKSENWRRVEELYPKVQGYLLDEVEKMPLSEERKEFLRKKIRETKLTLPYQDPKRAKASKECGKTTKNAYYHPWTHKFTVCAGIFNSIQSPSALALIIAHEISHSFDSERESKNDWLQNSEFGQKFSQLANAKGPVFSCDDWSGILKQAASIWNGPLAEEELNPLDPLYSCLAPRNNLHAEFTADNLKRASEMKSGGKISESAGYHEFMQIAQPQSEKFGEVKLNETFMRPDLLIASQDGHRNPKFDRDPEPAEIFTQSYACTRLKDGQGREINYKNATQEQRQQLFAKAIENTKMVLAASYADYSTFCGKACASLVPYGLSVNPQENFSDWSGFRALAKYLANDVELKNRWEASANAVSLFCSPPNIASSAPELAVIEKQFNMEQHADDRVRRVSMYIPEIAGLLGCKINENEKGYARCKL